MAGLFSQFRNDAAGCTVVFEDDGRVGYAYWLDENGCIVGDVWLYNRCETPSEAEWPDRGKAPFANPLPYAKTQPAFVLPEKMSDVWVEWLDAGARAKVVINNEPAALLEAGAKPGWAAMAAKDGPLARVLTP